MSRRGRYARGAAAPHTLPTIPAPEHPRRNAGRTSALTGLVSEAGGLRRTSVDATGASVPLPPAARRLVATDEVASLLLGLGRCSSGAPERWTGSSVTGPRGRLVYTSRAYEKIRINMQTLFHDLGIATTATSRPRAAHHLPGEFDDGVDHMVGGACTRRLFVGRAVFCLCAPPARL